MKLLLCEDDPGIAEAIADSLRLVGIEVTVCGTYVAAIDSLKHLPVEAVVSDGQFAGGIVGMSMIGSYGIPLLNEAKRLGKAVVLLSGNDELVRDAKALGIPALTKPVSVNQILEALDRQWAEESFKAQSKRKGNGG
mgnify:CR=1 FL=1